jgi:hypothetical protein
MTNNINSNNPLNNQELSYKKEKIEEVLNIINTLQFTGFDGALKLTRIFDIMNEPFNLNKKFPNPVKPIEKENNKD